MNSDPFQELLKQNEPTKTENIPINVESQKIALALSKKNIEISFLKRQLSEKLQYIASIQSELFALKKFYSDSSKLKQQLDRSIEKNEQQEKEIENLKQKIIDQHKEFTEEKRIIEKNHLSEISKLKVTIDSYIQKTLRANMNELDNEKLNLQLDHLKKQHNSLLKRSEQDLVQKDIQNKIKISKLKDKMLENINMTKEEVTELNMQYLDVSTKLTLLQNHQLLVQLDYQSQQLDESTKKIELLEKKIFDLNKDLEIHKQVEVTFAEKNKKLKEELKKYIKKDNKENKEIKLSEENGANNNKSIGDSNNQQSSNISLLSNNSNINKINNNDYTRIINLEKKVINLEKKLEHKKKEYNDLKAKYEHIDNVLKNQEKKYSGLYHFFEESLNQFFLDESIINNKNIYINNESLKKYDFSNLTKEEKYSTLIILMKYLMPLIHGENDIININNTFIDNCRIKYHFPKNNKLTINDKFRKIIRKKQVLRNSSSDNIHKIINFKGTSSFENLPSIIRGSSLRKVNTKIPTTISATSNKTLNYSPNNNN
jgi:hypothetical protein